jgi:hypothetical protein
MGGYYLMNRLPQTPEELLLLYVKAVNELLDSVKAKEKELKKAKDNEPKTVMHYTTRLVQDWFRSKGGLPIPD